MMKIRDFPRGPYQARLRIAVAEKNLQSRVRFELLDLYKGAHKTPAFATRARSFAVRSAERAENVNRPG